MAVTTNSMGWVVELYLQEKGGWGAVTPPMTEAQAEEALPSWQSQDAPARVYEALNHPNQRIHEHLLT